MADIQKLDYSAPPPRGRSWQAYKLCYDPPGLQVASYGSAVFWVQIWASDNPVAGPFQADEMSGSPWAVRVQQAESACRAAAWAWYDTRLGLANTHSAAWPQCLGYTSKTCAELLEKPASEEMTRQAKEYFASSLALLDYSGAPPSWRLDAVCGWAYEETSPRSNVRRCPVDVAWSHYKAEHNPPGMWCGCSRGAHEMETCSLRAGVSACGARWELMLNLRVPFKGYLAKCRAWAWAWHDRRHALARRMMQDVDVADMVQFHLILCWHDEWVAAVDAWLVEKSAPPPEALATLQRKQARR